MPHELTTTGSAAAGGGRQPGALYDDTGNFGGWLDDRHCAANALAPRRRPRHVHQPLLPQVARLVIFFVARDASRGGASVSALPVCRVRV